MTSYPLVRAEWLDSTLTRGWMEGENVIEMHASKCITVGYLVRETEEELVIVGSLSYTDNELPDMAAITVIPKCSMKSRTNDPGMM